MKKIEILERINEPSDFAFNYILRVEVPAEQQSFTGIDAKTGTYTLEKNGQIFFPAGKTIEDVKAALEKLWLDFDAEIKGRKRFEFFGLSWDGEKWQ